MLPVSSAVVEAKVKAHIYYVVLVQDIGETLEYEFQDLAQAERPMSIEMLECSLWRVDRRSNTRLRLDEHKVSS